MNRITAIKILEGYQIAIRFHDGLETVIDLQPFLGKGFTKELLVLSEFQKVTIESGGGLVWPNGFDICPNYLRELAEQREHVA
jgi:hypothetical protein